jgi:hypothetical protein
MYKFSKMFAFCEREKVFVVTLAAKHEDSSEGWAPTVSPPFNPY